MKKVTVMLREGASTEETASRLRKLGVKQVSELTHIGCIVGEWEGALDAIKRVDGVEDVEEQTSRYYPT